MRTASREERIALIIEILSVFNNAEKASLKAIKEFAPYVNEKGRALPFLCKSRDDFTTPVSEEEYQDFLQTLVSRLYPSYFAPKMDFRKAVAELCNCISSSNYVAYDYIQFVISKFKMTGIGIPTNAA